MTPDGLTNRTAALLAAPLVAASRAVAHVFVEAGLIKQPRRGAVVVKTGLDFDDVILSSAPNQVHQDSPDPGCGLAFWLPKKPRLR